MVLTNNMKTKITSLVAILFFSLSINAQAPEKMNYQAVVRTPLGTPLANQSVSAIFEIREATANGLDVYKESQVLLTNQFGLINAEIGGGTQLSTNPFDSISWGTNLYYLYVEINGDPMGTSQLLSVPYALHAKNNLPGPQGPQGLKGDTGVIGPQGPQGIQGVAGPVGPQGPVGQVGPQGPVGAQGIQGVQGIQGLMGVQGVKGDSGSANINGTPNYLIKFNSSSSGINSQIYDNGASVGIGTATPGAELHVVGHIWQVIPGNSTFIGFQAGANDNQAGTNQNTFVGVRAGNANVSGTNNTALGYHSLRTAATGGHNTSIGSGALGFSTGAYNTAIGSAAMFSNAGGGYNVTLGWNSGYDNTSGMRNVAIGSLAGMVNTTGSNNTFIGYNAKPGAGYTNLTNATAIGYNSIVNTSNSLILGNGANVGIGTSTPSAKLDIVGTMQLADGNHGAGKVLTSDAAGNATWATNSIYTQSGSLNNLSVNATTVWQATGAVLTVNKTYADSKIEVTFNSRIYAGAFSGTSGVFFEIRIDGNTANFDNQAAITSSGSNEFVSMFAVFSGISTGVHTIEVYARTYSGSTTGTIIDTGGWGGRMIAKETF